jgi:hypothetical protein
MNKDDYKFIFDELVLCVTRRCNLACFHCMRGKYQNKDMSKKLIDIVLSQTQRIHTVTFSGGEPSLATKVIDYFLKSAKASKVTIGSFYIVTSGIKESRELINTMLDLYSYCDEPDYCSFRISGDRFHHGNKKPNTKLYESIVFYNKEESFYEYTTDSTYDQGYAHDNQLGSRKLVFDVPYLDIDKDSGIIDVHNKLYIGTTGNVLTTCDVSYKNELKFSFGNVMNSSIYSIFEKYIDPLS